MVKAPLIVVSLMIVALSMPIQSSFSSTRNLDLIIYPDGSTHVSTEVDVDPLAPDYEMELFGPS
ncbi:MAG: MarR family transcriptional regulator, partial [Nitrosopumilaceae archaeon]|nr:MarR family transcriptional regulator [Nitrosopumilaceae archaeon]